jgi:hypothetical protein
VRAAIAGDNDSFTDAENICDGDREADAGHDAIRKLGVELFRDRGRPVARSIRRCEADRISRRKEEKHLTRPVEERLKASVGAKVGPLISPRSRGIPRMRADQFAAVRGSDNPGYRNPSDSSLRLASHCGPR